MDGSRERDEAVERLLRQSRQRLPLPRNGGVTDSCLDAETAAAWIDSGLSGAALEMAQSHVADCARCQALVGTLARIDASVSQAKPERDSRRWLAWLVPLTAAAAAVALWVAVPRDKSDRLPLATEARREAVQTKAQEPATLDNRSPAPARAPRVGAELPPPRAAATEKKQDQAVAKGAGVSNQVRAQAPESRRDAERFNVDRLTPQRGVVGGTIAPSAPAVAAAAPGPAAPADEGRPGSAPANAALAKSSASPAPAPAARGASALAESITVVTRPAAIEIGSRDQSIRWRVAGPVVQRSTNGGSTWEAVPTGIAAELTAGAAPSASVCWLVGRGGVVLLMTDGRTWGRVAFPEATDLSSVRATDARVASVSTADGRTFSTTDGGVTWVRRPLQEF